MSLSALPVRLNHPAKQRRRSSDKPKSGSTIGSTNRSSTTSPHYTYNRESRPNAFWLSFGYDLCNKAQSRTGEVRSLATRYRNHLILEKANFDPATGYWTVRAHIQFNEHITF